MTEELMVEQYEVVKPPPRKRAKKQVEVVPEVAPEVVEVPELEAPTKKPPTEKQLAARERARVKREEKKKEAETEALKALYAQSMEMKAEQVRVEAEAARKAAIAAKRKEAREAKKLVKELGDGMVAIKDSSTVTKSKGKKLKEEEPVFSQATASIENFKPIALPGEYKPVETNVYAKGKAPPFGYDRTGIKPRASTEGVTPYLKSATGRASSGGKGRFGL